MAPRLEVGLFNRRTVNTADDLDAAYDGTLIGHEVAHGPVNRLIGKGDDLGCTTGFQSMALGEGWSDYFAASYYDNPVSGAYVAGDAKGLRRNRHDSNPLHYGDLGNAGYEEHRDGEIWTAILWDMRKAFGAQVADKLVLEALKATPCGPTFVQARDALLAVDKAANGGVRRAAIWNIFAKRGLGQGACGFEAPPPPAWSTTRLSTFRRTCIPVRPLPPWLAPPAESAASRRARRSATPSSRRPASRCASSWSWPARHGGGCGRRGHMDRGLHVAARPGGGFDAAGQKTYHTFQVPVATPLRLGETTRAEARKGESGYALVAVPAGTGAIRSRCAAPRAMRISTCIRPPRCGAVTRSIRARMKPSPFANRRAEPG